MIESISIADEALITDRDDILDNHDDENGYSDYKPVKQNTVKVNKTSG